MCSVTWPSSECSEQGEEPSWGWLGFAYCQQLSAHLSHLLFPQDDERPPVQRGEPVPAGQVREVAQPWVCCVAASA